MENGGSLLCKFTREGNYLLHRPPREAEQRSDDIYEKLPLFQIEEKFGKTEAGK